MKCEDLPADAFKNNQKSDGVAAKKSTGKKKPLVENNIEQTNEQGNQEEENEI